MSTRRSRTGTTGPSTRLVTLPAELDLRNKLGALIGASGEEIALIQTRPSAPTHGQRLTLAPGDEVIMTNQEHVGCESPWQLRAKRYGSTSRGGRPDAAENPQQMIDLFVNASTRRRRCGRSRT